MTLTATSKMIQRPSDDYIQRPSRRSRLSTDSHSQIASDTQYSGVL